MKVYLLSKSEGNYDDTWTVPLGIYADKSLAHKIAHRLEGIRIEQYAKSSDCDKNSLRWLRYHYQKGNKGMFTISVDEMRLRQ